MCCPFRRRLGQPPIRDDLVLGWSAGGREGALRCEGAGGLRAEGAGSVCPQGRQGPSPPFFEVLQGHHPPPETLFPKMSNVDEIASQLRAAMAGWSTDDSVLIKVLFCSVFVLSFS